MKLFPLVLFVLILYPSVTSNNAQMMPFYTLRSESIDLKVDGSITTQSLTLQKNYTYIRRIIIELIYTDVNFVYDKFGEGTALTNGTAIIVYGSPYFDFNITRNYDILCLSQNSIIFTDDSAPNCTIVVAEIVFDRFWGVTGLYITNNESLYFMVQDDLTNAGLGIAHFKVIVEGAEETLVKEQPQAKNWIGWLNEVWLSISTETTWLLIIFLCVIVLPLVAWRKLR